jgi:hypothetical protein
MAGSDAKDRIIYPLEKRVVNPVVLLARDLGFPTPGDALLETTGRRTGQRGARQCAMAWTGIPSGW